MPRITTLLIIILFLCACGKTDKNTETAQDSASVIVTEAESQPLTEAECWKLFDTFWMEFQRAIVNDDTLKLRAICNIEGDSWTFEEVLKAHFLNPNFKKMIKRMNKENKYTYKYGGSCQYLQHDSHIYICIENNEYKYFVMSFHLINSKYKLTECYGAYPKF